MKEPIDRSEFEMIFLEPLFRKWVDEARRKRLIPAGLSDQALQHSWEWDSCKEVDRTTRTKDGHDGYENPSRSLPEMPVLAAIGCSETSGLLATSSS